MFVGTYSALFLRSILDDREYPMHRPVTQAGHGFVVGDVITMDNTGTYTKAQADASTTLGIGIVGAVIDANTFDLVHAGYIQHASHGYTVDAALYVSAATPGALTETPPSAPNYVQMIAWVADASSYLVWLWGADEGA